MFGKKTEEIKADVVVTVTLCAVHKDYCEVPVMKKGKETGKKVVHYPTVVAMLGRICNCGECSVRFE